MREKNLPESRAAGSWWSCFSRSVGSNDFQRSPLTSDILWSCNLCYRSCSKFSSCFCWGDLYFCTHQVESNLFYVTQQCIATSVGCAWAPATAIPFSTVKGKTCTLSRVTGVSFNLTFLVLALRSPSGADAYLGLMRSPLLNLGELAYNFLHIYPKTFYCIWTVTYYFHL